MPPAGAEDPDPALDPAGRAAASCCCSSWVVAGAVCHVVFLFLVAGADRAAARTRSCAALGRVRIPRGFSVAIVFLSFAAALIVGIGRPRRPSSSTRRRRPRTGSTPTLRTSTDRPARRTPSATSTASRRWLNDHGSSGSRSRSSGHDFVDADPRARTSRSTRREVDRLRRGRGDLDRRSCSSRSSLILVVSIYMLLDMRPAASARSTGASRRARARGRCSPRIEQRARRLRAGARCSLSLIIGDERGRRDVAARGARLGPGRRQVRAPLRRLGRGHGADPVPRPVARRDPAGRSTRSSSTRSRRSGSRCSSSSSTRSRATSSSRT